MEDLNEIMNFYMTISKLKQIFRFSSLDGVTRKESTADHTWRLAFMTYTLAEKLELSVDILKSMKLAIIHDLPELIVDDVDYRDVHAKKITVEEKLKNEKKGIQTLVDMLKINSSLATQIYDLWYEYEAMETEEAKFVKALDKIEGLLQSVEYGKEIYPNPEILFTYADKHVKRFPALIPILKITKEKLKAEFAHKIDWKEEYNYALVD